MQHKAKTSLVRCCTLEPSTKFGVLDQEAVREAKFSRTVPAFTRWQLAELRTVLSSNCFRMDNGLDGLSEKSNPLLLSRLCCSLPPQLLQLAVLCRLYALSYCTPPAPPPVYGSASTLSQHAASTSSHANEPVSVRPGNHASCFKPRLCVQSARTCGSTAALAGSAAPRDVRSSTTTTVSQTRGDRR